MSRARHKPLDSLPGSPALVRFEWHGQQLPQQDDEVRLARTAGAT